MNKPKPTTIELTDDMIDAAQFVYSRHSERLSVPGEYKVWREDGKIYLEVFHNG